MEQIINYIKNNSENLLVHNFFYQRGGKNWHIDKRTISNNMLVFCLGGSGEYIAEGKSIATKKGRVILITHSVEHSAKQDEKDPAQVLALRFSVVSAVGESNIPKGSFYFDSFNFATLNDIFARIGKHIAFRDNDNKSIANRLLSTFFLLLESECMAYKNRVYDEYLENINSVIEKSIALNNPIDTSEWYAHYGSEYKFLKAFKSYYDTTFKSYCFIKKMEYVRMMLEETNLSINEIAQLTGYSDQYILSNQFKRIYGVSPKKHRNICGGTH